MNQVKLSILYFQVSEVNRLSHIIYPMDVPNTRFSAVHTSFINFKFNLCSAFIINWMGWSFLSLLHCDRQQLIWDTPNRVMWKV
jgi:hypothetical protein